MIAIAASTGTGLAVAAAVLLARPRIRARSRPRPAPSLRAVLAGGATASAVCLAGALLTGSWVVALPPSLLAGAIPAALETHRRRAAGDAVRAAWPDALRDLVASLRAGSTIEGALAALEVSGPEPITRVLSGFGIRVRVVGLTAALEEIREALADPVADRVVEVLLVAAERGGSIVPDLLSDLARSVTEDGWMAEEIRTAVLEHRINAWAVFSLPWLILLVLARRSGPYAEFYRSATGALVVLLGALASGAGIWWVVRLAGITPEPRVFGRSEP